MTSRSCRSRSSVPVSAEWATSSRRPSGLWPAASSSTGSTPTRRRQAFASALSATSSGRVTAMKARIGRASRIAERSGCAIAHDFGAISPMTRCTKVTTTSATTNATTSAVTAGRPHAVNTGRSRSCTAGFATAPSPSVHSVMPSCEPASSSEMSRALRSAARAATLVSAASSSRYRRAATRANSTATKNALSATRPTATAMATAGLSPFTTPPPARCACAPRRCPAPGGPPSGPSAPARPRCRRRRAGGAGPG